MVSYPLNLIPEFTVEEGDALGSGAVVVGREGRGGGAGGDLLLHGPEDSFIIVRVLLHIREGVGDGGVLLVLEAPEEGDDLGSGDKVAGTERRFTGAVGDPLLHRPEHRLVVVGALLAFSFYIISIIILSY